MMVNLLVFMNGFFLQKNLMECGKGLFNNSQFHHGWKLKLQIMLFIILCSLIYDSGLKQRLLRYAASALLFTEKGVNHVLVSWNRWVLLNPESLTFSSFSECLHYMRFLITGLLTWWYVLSILNLSLLYLNISFLEMLKPFNDIIHALLGEFHIASQRLADPSMTAMQHCSSSWTPGHWQDVFMQSIGSKTLNTL